MNLLLKDTIRVFLIIGLILAGILLFNKGCANPNIYTEGDYYRDNPNAKKTYEQFLKEEKQEQDLKEDIKNKLKYNQ